jgi:hypothetical protein
MIRPGPGRISLMMLTEAGWSVFVASLLIRLAKFDRVATWAVRDGRAWRDPDPAVAAAVARAVTACCRRLPWRALCMEQGVACARMLSRRRYPVALHYGAAMRGSELEAHVWLVSGELDVVGCDIADQFVRLARFPEL